MNSAGNLEPATLNLTERRTTSVGDVNQVKTWVKDVLFEKVKFLYDQEDDLQVGGALFEQFVIDLKGRLSGEKKHSLCATPYEKKQVEEYNQFYYQLLWRDCTAKGKNLVAKGLDSKRSTALTAMSNKFIGK